MKRRGVPFSSQAIDVRKKVSMTWKRKSKEEIAERTKKTIATCQQKYHVDNVFQLESIKQKIRNTNMNNLGVEYPSQAPEVREKQR